MHEYETYKRSIIKYLAQRKNMFIIKSLLALTTIFFVVACGGGGGSPGSNPTQSSLSVTAGELVILQPGEFQSYTISGGVPPYTTSSSEPKIASGNVRDKTFSIGALTGGNASLRIFDRSGTTISVAVTVGSSTPFYSTAPSTFTLRAPGQKITCNDTGSVPGETVEYEVVGGTAPYTAVSNQPQIVTVGKAANSSFRFSAVARGTAQITIFDSSNSNAPITLTVNSGILSGTPDLVNTLEKIKIPIGVESRVLISGGFPPYYAAGNIPATISVTPSCSDNGEFRVSGKLAGTFDVGFVDSNGSFSPLSNFEFIPDAASFRASPGLIQISENSNPEYLEFQLTGFTGDTGSAGSGEEICIYVSDPSYFTLDPSRSTCSLFSSANRSFRLIRGTRDSFCVSSNKSISLNIIDSKGFIATGSTDEDGNLVPPLITLLNNGTACEDGRSDDDELTALPSKSVTLSATATVTDVFVMGGSGSYFARSANALIATATLTGNRLEVNRLAAGNTTITVTDASAPTKVITISVTSN